MTPARSRGKGALFSQAPDPMPDDDRDEAAGPSPRTTTRGGLRSRAATGAASGTGRQQIFSAGTTGRTWTVSCRSCRAETPVTGADLARRLVRFGSLWWPLGRYPHRMPCPACGDTTWCQVRWRSPRPRH